MPLAAAEPAHSEGVMSNSTYVPCWVGGLWRMTITKERVRVPASAERVAATSQHVSQVYTRDTGPSWLCYRDRGLVWCGKHNACGHRDPERTLTGTTYLFSLEVPLDGQPESRTVTIPCWSLVVLNWADR